MERTLIRSLGPTSLNETFTLKGWVQAVRSHKSVQFVILRDHTGILQLVHERLEGLDVVGDTIDGLTLESAVEVTGTLLSDPRVKLGQRELGIHEITVVNRASVPLPIDANTKLDGRLDWRFLDLRRPENYLIFQVQTVVEEAMRSFWSNNGFIEIHSPKLMGSASESGAELFEVKYFEGVAYLAQSPQFYKQMAMAAGMDRIFEIGPVFRANPSFTSRHDTEFTSIDVEVSWTESHEDLMRLEESWLAYVLGIVKGRLGRQIAEVYGQEVVVPTIPFPRVTLLEARELLSKLGHQIPSENPDLDPEGERLLSDQIAKRYGHEFVFVTDYPASVRAFYHMRYPYAPDVTMSFDLLWKGLEVTTGAQREHRYDILLRQAQEKGISQESIQFYLDFFRYGCPPHGGYGFGLTRMLMLMLGLKNVREVTYLYRGPNRLTP